MTEENKYSPLKHIGALMALDTAAVVVENVVFLLEMSLRTDSQAEALLAGAALYGVWTAWLLRLMIWALALVSLSRLTGLRKSFGKARIWYLSRFLVFFAQALTVTVGNYRAAAGTVLSSPELALIVGALLAILAMNYIGECLLSAGNRAVLFADAEFLDSLGLESQPGKLRRCGNRLAGCAAAQTLLLLLAIALVLCFRPAGGPFPLDNEIRLGALLCALLLCFLAGLGATAYRILAAVYMLRTYRAIKELTE